MPVLLQVCRKPVEIGRKSVRVTEVGGTQIPHGGTGKYSPPRQRGADAPMVARAGLDQFALCFIDLPVLGGSVPIPGKPDRAPDQPEDPEYIKCGSPSVKGNDETTNGGVSAAPRRDPAWVSPWASPRSPGKSQRERDR